MNERLLEKLVCPLCRNGVEIHNGVLMCSRCSETYPFVDNMPNFLPAHLMAKYNGGLKQQNLKEEMAFYERMYKDLKGVDDGHCVVYGYDEIYEYMRDVPKGTLLDIGCGAGHHSKDLSLRGYEVTGVDISLNGLRQARTVSSVYGQSIDFLLADVENLPFADNAFDVVFCSLIIHHFPKRKKLISEVARVCKRYFITFEVNSYDPVSFLRFNIINPTIGIHNITKNQRTVSPIKLEQELLKSKFVDIAVKYVDVHHNVGRYPGSIEAKLLEIYRNLMSILPYKYRFNKFIMKAAKGCSS